MTIRPYQPGDEPILRDIYARFGYKWDFPDDLSSYQVLCDDTGKILMAAGWRLVPEIGLLCDPDKAVHPLVKLKGIAMLHEKLRGIIRASGHKDAIAFVAPELKRFSRHLQRQFGWLAEWPALRIFVKEGD